MNNLIAAKSAPKTEPLHSVTSNVAVAPVESNSIQATIPLTVAEKQLLAQHEATIRDGIKTFTKVGNALLEVRDKGLYREQYAIFENYCREKWKFSVRKAYLLMGASSVVQNLEREQLFTPEPIAIPASESAARPLAGLSPEKQVAAARIVATQPGEHTAKDFKDAANHVARKSTRKTAGHNFEDEEKPRVKACDPSTYGIGDKADLEKLLELLDAAQTQARRVKGCGDVAKVLGDLAKTVTNQLNGGGK